jgi:hypothetical protein
MWFLIAGAWLWIVLSGLTAWALSRWFRHLREQD